MNDLAAIGSYSIAQSISESGLIVGEAGIQGNSHAVIWNWNGQVEDLGGQSIYSTATGVNSGGIVVGVSNIKTGNVLTSGFHAVMWR